MDGRAERTPTVHIVQLDLPTLRSLASGDLAAANATSSVPLTETFVGDDWRRTWRMRAQQVARDPEAGRWVTGVVWDPGSGRAVGRAGFHGPPDAAGTVEVGYSTDPACAGAGTPAPHCSRCSSGPRASLPCAPCERATGRTTSPRWRL